METQRNKAVPIGFQRNRRLKWHEALFILAMMAISVIVLAVVKGWIAPASLGV